MNDNKKMIENCQRLEKLFITISADDNIGSNDVEMSVHRINSLTKEIKNYVTNYFFQKIFNNKILMPESYEYIILYIQNNIKEYSEHYIYFLEALLKMLELDINKKLTHAETFRDPIIETCIDIIKYVNNENKNYYDNDFYFYNQELKKYVLQLKKYIDFLNDTIYITWFNKLIDNAKVEESAKIKYKHTNYFNKEEHEKFCKIFMISENKDDYNFTGCTDDDEYKKIIEDSNNISLDNYEEMANIQLRLGKLSNKYKRVKNEDYRPLYVIAYEIIDELRNDINTNKNLKFFLTNLSELYSMKDTPNCDFSPIQIINYIIFYIEDIFVNNKIDKLLNELKYISFKYFNNDNET